MENNRRTKVWLPFIIAASIAVGIFIGNYYKVLSGKQQGRAFSNGDKISAILGIINEQYVDTVNMNDLIENTIPKIFGELDPHSVYIPAITGETLSAPDKRQRHSADVRTKRTSQRRYNPAKSADA